MDNGNIRNAYPPITKHSNTCHNNISSPSHQQQPNWCQCPMQCWLWNHFWQKHGHGWAPGVNTYSRIDPYHHKHHYFTSTMNTRTYPFHQPSCGCYLQLQWGKGNTPIMPYHFQFADKSNIFASHLGGILARVHWCHLQGYQTSHHGSRTCHGPRTLKTMQTGHSVNQTHPMTTRT